MHTEHTAAAFQCSFHSCRIASCAAGGDRSATGTRPLRGAIEQMQTRCPKCSTMVKSTGPHWEIINGSCPELSGTQWKDKPEFCPILSLVAEPDVSLPGASNRTAVQAEIDLVRVTKVHDDKQP